MLIILMCFIALLAIPQVAKAAIITSASLDKATYLAGQTGYISVTVYNDRSNTIRVTELSATINYYYLDGTVYVQKFFTSATLPDEIPVGESETYQISISLPTNIASGYINPTVEARTEIWWPQTEIWISSDRPTYNLKLYIESAYKQLYETSQQELQSTEQQLTSTEQQLQTTQEELQSTEQELTSTLQQLQDQEIANKSLTNTMYILAATTILFASAAAASLFVLFTRKPRTVAQS